MSLEREEKMGLFRNDRSDEALKDELKQMKHRKKRKASIIELKLSLSSQRMLSSVMSPI